MHISSGKSRMLVMEVGKVCLVVMETPDRRQIRVMNIIAQQVALSKIIT